jgi:hypothetical protein
VLPKDAAGGLLVHSRGRPSQRGPVLEVWIETYAHERRQTEEYAGTNILGGGRTVRARIISTRSAAAKPIALDPASCHTLTFRHVASSGSARTHIRYGGSVEMDCTSDRGDHVTGTIEYTGC